MAKLAIKKDLTSVSLYLFIQNSSVTTGAGLTGLAFNSAGLTAYYVRPLTAAAAITLATQTVSGAFSSGGFVEVDATNMPGVYRFDVPNAALATGVNSVVVMLKGATNMAQIVLEIDLVAYDPQSATNLGLTQVDAIKTETASIQADTDNLQTRVPVALVAGRMDSSAGAIAANAITAASMAVDAGQEIADSILLRNLDRTGSGTDSVNERTVVNALRAIRNKVSISAGTLTVTKEDDIATAWTAAVTTAAGNPLTGVDPA